MSLLAVDHSKLIEQQCITHLNPTVNQYFNQSTYSKNAAFTDKIKFFLLIIDKIPVITEWLSLLML